MLKNSDYSLISVVSAKRQGIVFSKQFIKCLSFVGLIEKISSIYQFKSEDPRFKNIQNTFMTHIAFCTLIQLRDDETVGEDFGKQIQQFAEKSAQMQHRDYEVCILDFRSQFSMCQSLTIPFPGWIKRAEMLFPSLEVLPDNYVHPVLKCELSADLIADKTWVNSEFFMTGRSLMSLSPEV